MELRRHWNEYHRKKLSPAYIERVSCRGKPRRPSDLHRAKGEHPWIGLSSVSELIDSNRRQLPSALVVLAMAFIVTRGVGCRCNAEEEFSPAGPCGQDRDCHWEPMCYPTRCGSGPRSWEGPAAHACSSSQPAPGNCNCVEARCRCVGPCCQCDAGNCSLDINCWFKHRPAIREGSSYP